MPSCAKELAASFKTQGILAPLLVRELEESKYEVVAGDQEAEGKRRKHQAIGHPGCIPDRSVIFPPYERPFAGAILAEHASFFANAQLSCQPS
ncbi:MAG: ParB N-terminal domain-containing protein [Candidatus Sulfotelmatobacter sp.]